MYDIGDSDSSWNNRVSFSDDDRGSIDGDSRRVFSGFVVIIIVVVLAVLVVVSFVVPVVSV